MGMESRSDARPEFPAGTPTAERTRDASRQHTQLLNMLSHELRNPLAAIVNAASLLNETSVSETDDRAARDIIVRNACHVSMLLDDLLDFSQFTCRTISLRQQVVDLCQLARDVVRRMQDLADERHQQLHLRTEPTPLYVAADKRRIEQAQLNLLFNAIKYTGTGGRIEVSLQREEDSVVVRVSDNGIGIPRELLPRVFEPFVQSDQSLDRAQGGMGLGLPLVRLIVEAHAGSITAESHGAGQGSAFTMRLPLTGQPPPPDNMPATDTAGKRMVIVEDNPGIRKMLARSMELQGFKVAVAANGHEGLETVRRQTPDVAIIDIGLPDVDGYELARRIRKQPAYQSTLLVAFTGYGQETDRAEALAAGFDLHLVKPLDPQRLLAAITAAWAVSSAVTLCPSKA